MNPQATLRLEEGTPLFIALLKECRKIETEETVETDFDGNVVINTPLELGGEIVAEWSFSTIRNDEPFKKVEWITLFLG